MPPSFINARRSGGASVVCSGFCHTFSLLCATRVVCHGALLEKLRSFTIHLATKRTKNVISP